MKRQSSLQLAARRREVVSLTHKGWTQTAIAGHLKIPQGTVSRDVAAMRRYWRDFPVHDFENVRLEQLQKIDVTEAEAWAPWERSQQRRQIAQLIRGNTGEQTRTNLQDQHGDLRITQMHKKSALMPRWCPVDALQGPVGASARIAAEPIITHYIEIA